MHFDMSVGCFENRGGWRMANVFAGRSGILAAGGAIGLTAALLQFAGNPANMGICVACFLRDIAGSLGLHQAGVVQYLRPEIPAFVLGSFAAALLTGEFRARAGSAPATRFFLGMCAMAGAPGVPWLPLAGVLAPGGRRRQRAVRHRRAGRRRLCGHPVLQGRLLPRPRRRANGWSGGVMIALAAVALLAARFFLMPDPAAGTLGWLFASLKGPGAARAPLYISLGAGLLIGVLAQRSPLLHHGRPARTCSCSARCTC